MDEKPLKVLMLAGEVSGDMYGGALLKTMREKFGNGIVCKGMGGDAMKNAGADLLYHTDQLAAMGITEIIKQLAFFKKVMADILSLAEQWKPDVVITIDYAGFNVRVAKKLHDKGFKTVQYISPKVWVWRANRIYKIAKAFDLLLCIFPFEPNCYKTTNLKTVFIGNPLTEQIKQTKNEPEPVLPWGDAEKRIALLPGSRKLEIQRLLPLMLKTSEIITEKCDENVAFLIPVPTEKMRREVEKILVEFDRITNVKVVDGFARHVMKQSSAALIASGTATLEACLMGCPTVLTYRVSAGTALFAKIVTRGNINHVGLANIIAGKEIMPELLQRDFTPGNAAEKIMPLLENSVARRNMLAEFEKISELLGDVPASERAANEIFDLLKYQNRHT